MTTMGLDGFSMRPLAIELRAALVGGRIDRITQPNKATVMMAVRQPGLNRLLNISLNPQNPAAYLTCEPPINPAEPPLFCMVLRKHLDGGRIADIKQHGTDRLLTVDVDTLAGGGVIVTKTIVLELMGKYSNFILLENGRIIDAWRKIGPNRSRVRTVLPGEEYILPPAQGKLDVFAATPEAIISRIKAQPTAPLRTALMGACLGFGPVSTGETMLAAGLDADMPVAALAEADFASLAAAIGELRAACLSDGALPQLVTDGHKILALASFPLEHIRSGQRQSFATVSAMLERAAALSGSHTLPDKERFQKLVRQESRRATNKLAVLKDELATAENADESKIKGDNLMTYQYELKDHAADKATVTDIYSETGASIEIELDRRLTIIQNMQNYYRRYDKLKRAQKMLQEQITNCQAEIDYLASISSSLESSDTPNDISEIRDELIAGGYLAEKPLKKSTVAKSEPFRFTAPDGTTILVGKNNSQNDKLTFKTANAQDIWLHTKDIPGSHVIMRSDGREPIAQTLLLAAKLAAYFSPAKNSANVPVDYTRCRYIKKPPGAKPGFVTFTQQKTVYVTPDESELAEMLQQKQP